MDSGKLLEGLSNQPLISVRVRSENYTDIDKTYGANQSDVPSYNRSDFETHTEHSQVLNDILQYDSTKTASKSSLCESDDNQNYSSTPYAVTVQTPVVKLVMTTVTVRG